MLNVFCCKLFQEKGEKVFDGTVFLFFQNYFQGKCIYSLKNTSVLHSKVILHENGLLGLFIFCEFNYLRRFY